MDPSPPVSLSARPPALRVAFPPSAPSLSSITPWTVPHPGSLHPNLPPCALEPPPEPPPSVAARPPPGGPYLPLTLPGQLRPSGSLHASRCSASPLPPSLGVAAAVTFSPPLRGRKSFHKADPMEGGGPLPEWDLSVAAGLLSSSAAQPLWSGPARSHASPPQPPSVPSWASSPEGPSPAAPVLSPTPQPPQGSS